MKTSRKLVSMMLMSLFFVNTILLSVSPFAYAQVPKLVILSPHPKPFFDVVVNGFKDYYRRTFGTDVTITQDFKDSAASARAVATWAGKPPPDEAIFWGGGKFFFDQVKEWLGGYDSREKVNMNATYYGWPLYDPDNPALPRWYAAALSTFGAGINLDALGDLPVPETWDDLLKPEYEGKIVMANPQRSGSTLVIVMMMIHLKGWEGGWRYWLQMASQIKEYTPSSTDVPTKVSLKEYPIGLMIDFFSVQFGLKYSVLGSTVTSPDPVALISGASDSALNVGKVFIDWVLSTEGQSFVVKGARLPIRSDVQVPPPLQSPWQVPLQIPGFNETFEATVSDFVAGMFYNWIIVNQGLLVNSLQSLSEAGSIVTAAAPQEAKTSLNAADEALFSIPISRGEAETFGAKWKLGPTRDDVLIQSQSTEWQKFGFEHFTEARQLALSSIEIAQHATVFKPVTEPTEAIQAAQNAVSSYGDAAARARELSSTAAGAISSNLNTGLALMGVAIIVAVVTIALSLRRRGG